MPATALASGNTGVVNSNGTNYGVNASGEYGGQLNNSGQDISSSFINNSASSNTAPAPTPAPAKPVTSLSTDNAVQTVQSGLTALNKYAPAAPVNNQNTSSSGSSSSTTSNNQNTSTQNNNSGNNSSNSGSSSGSSTPAPSPTASFMNADGTEAEFTQDQLNDPATQNLIKSGGYIMTKTTGPSLPTSADQGAQLQNEVTAATDKIQALSDEFASYNLDNDPDFAPIVTNIKSTYNQLSAQMQQQNTARAAQATTLGYRDGDPGSAPGVAYSLAGAELTAANGRLADIASKESAAITSARTAYQNGKYTEFNDQMNSLKDVASEKETELKDYQTIQSAILKNFQTTNQRASEDEAISTLFSSGTTDVPGILAALNKQGYTGVTAKDISDTLTSFGNNLGGIDLKNLSGTVKDFYELQGSSQLPSSISSLPQSQQLRAWLNYIKVPTPKAGTSSGTKATGTKITLASAKKNGLPLSTVGMSEGDIAQSFLDSNVPDWFTQEYNNQNNSSTTADQLGSVWEQYRSAYNNASSTAASASGGP